MYGLIIVNQTLGHNSYKIKRFQEEFPKLVITFDVFVNNGTLCEIKDGNIIINLPKADFVIYLDKDYYLATMLEKCGYRLFNSSNFLRMCDDKNITLIECANHGIKSVDTIPSPLIYSNSLKSENYLFLDKVIERFGLPLVMKKVYGSLGEGVYLAHSKQELYDLYGECFRYPLLFEKYLETSKGKSLRVLVVDEKVIGIIERNGSDDFRSNYGAKTYSKNIKNPTIYIDFAQKIANLLHIEYAGIDLLYGDNNEPVLCEINSNAFFEEFEKTTSINVAKMVGEMILRKCGKQ